jgi:hypothetical protein
MILSLHFIFWQGLAGPFVQVFRDGDDLSQEHQKQWILSSEFSSCEWFVHTTRMTTFQSIVSKQNKAYTWWWALYLVMVYTRSLASASDQSLWTQPSRTQHPILQSREPQTVLEITSVGTQIMVYFFPGCAQLHFSRIHPKKWWLRQLLTSKLV